MHVLDCVRAGERAAATPAAAVIEEKHRIARSSDRLCDIQIALVAGVTVEEHYDTVRPAPSRDIEYGIQSLAPTLQRKLRNLGGVRRVSRDRIHRDRVVETSRRRHARSGHGMG